MENEQDFFSNLTPTSGGLIVIGIGLLLLRPGGFAIRRSLSSRIYNPPYSYPLYRSRIANPDTPSNRITNPIGRTIFYFYGKKMIKLITSTCIA